jgi:hypothetical protein
MIIAVDFDGTCVEHMYPEVGLSVPYAVPVLQRLVEMGHQLILYTMRSDEYLEHAVQWFCENDINLWAANTNPQQSEWTKSPKVYANIYIDDAAVGCPLRVGIAGTRMMVDWLEVSKTLTPGLFDG